MLHRAEDGKETNAGGWHNELPEDAYSKAAKKNASHPGSIENAAGMDGAAAAASKAAGHTKQSQPQMPDPNAGNTMSHTSDG